MVEPFTFIRIADTETTGFPPDAEMVEIGWTDIRYYPTGWAIEADGMSRFVNPGRPIPPGVTKIHGITDDMVVGGMDPEEARRFIGKGPDFICAHKADFDSKFLTGHGLPWICTLQSARHAWPGMPNYKNETLRQKLGIEVSGDAHRAGYDSAVTARILIKLFDVMTIEQMVKVSMPSYQPLRMPFGQHAGKRFSEIDSKYLYWLATKSDTSVGIKMAAKSEINKRAAATPPLEPELEPDPDAWRAKVEPF